MKRSNYQFANRLNSCYFKINKLINASTPINEAHKRVTKWSLLLYKFGKAHKLRVVSRALREGKDVLAVIALFKEGRLKQLEKMAEEMFIPVEYQEGRRLE